MRPRSAVLALLVCLGSVAVLFAQTTSQSSTTSASSSQALITLQSTVAALTGKSSVTDVTLSGTAEWIAGSDDETGAAIYKALPSANRLDISLTSGTRSEIRNVGASGPAGAWISPDGVSHAIALHKLIADPGWFPLFAFSNIASSPNSLLTYVGPETRNGVSVIHLSAAQQFSGPYANAVALMKSLSQVDIYLDSSSLLPVSYVFNIHPDDDASLAIPTEIRYSNYQSIAGAQIPLHVQRFVNNSLTLDLQFENAVLDSGLSLTTFAVQ